MWCNMHKRMPQMLPHCTGAWYADWVFFVVQKFFYFFLSGDWFYTQQCQTVSPAGEWSSGVTNSPPPCAACLWLALPPGWHLPQPQPGDSGQEPVVGNLCLQTLQCSTVFLTPHTACRTAVTEKALVITKASRLAKESKGHVELHKQISLDLTTVLCPTHKLRHFMSLGYL